MSRCAISSALGRRLAAGRSLQPICSATATEPRTSRAEPEDELGRKGFDAGVLRQAALSGGNVGGIGLGGVLVIVMLVWSFLLGLIITLVGLVAFGGFAKGRWY